MINIGGFGYREIWLVDFEFSTSPGERQNPVCMVALDLSSGKVLRLWEDQLRGLQQPPFSMGSDSLYVAYYASAEMGCHLALGWGLPQNLLDLYVEFRNSTNGFPTPCGSGLVGALIHFGLDGISALEKESMRQLVLRGGPWSDCEKQGVLDYCESDVLALKHLLGAMGTKIDMPRALLRGRYMQAAAKIEHCGIPVDVEILQSLRTNAEAIRSHLVRSIDSQYGVFDGHTFRSERWEQWLAVQTITWPRLPSGRLALSRDVFSDMAKRFPEVAPMHQLRVALAQLHNEGIAFGADGRNRCLLSPFRSRTGRNQPGGEFIFGLSSWFRGLIQPAPGWGLAYLDWEQQEFGIAAALSGDPAMLQAYDSGDPYLAFAKQVGAIPAEGTKETHKSLREIYKQCVLAVQYGMGFKSLSKRIDHPEEYAHGLLKAHRNTYSKFWAWSDAVVNHARLLGRLHTAFGWTCHINSSVNEPSIRNFPMQANGAEMLRLACCFATERGIRVCAPVHDAILIEAPLPEIEDAAAATVCEMGRASREVLDGRKLRVETRLIRHPDRFLDERGRWMWQIVMGALNRGEG
jgi:DNA polymerase I